ncbi:MAG TPA: permease [Maritimibacter sp.]|nr:permease [Maritimibacter sp.]
MEKILTYIAGLMFGVGVSLGGMANPAKVQNFFDVFGIWDPSLAFVMGGAVLITAPGYWLVFRRGKPLFASGFSVPTNRTIDVKLIGGSAVFGIGWGIAGFCPGASIPVTATLNPDVLIFTGAMIAGIFTAKGLMAWSASRNLQADQA